MQSLNDEGHNRRLDSVGGLRERGGGFASVDAPAPVAAERTPGHRSLNVLKRSKSSLESQRRFGSRVGSGGSLRGERTPGISERVDGDSLLVSIARAVDLLGAMTISRNMRSALML